ncbi:uncharacterized protein C8Q71DRAFT_863825 [Rhodofomes roseus]|uniref:Uncharacterized protein n=1 Tax=Rhodofomes roseus TaxID=34475 RepID=A0ABQ8JX60_9APHY|nr:uncharacterized protein C8Q71DRAFT_863825 [Rhodofomes roseus]KAH9828649.1 hypothetical protein C8Q71DRAFT_863825 [Rhodofomes roseus]
MPPARTRTALETCPYSGHSSRELHFEGTRAGSRDKCPNVEFIGKPADDTADGLGDASRVEHHATRVGRDACAVSCTGASADLALDRHLHLGDVNVHVHRDVHGYHNSPDEARGPRAVSNDARSGNVPRGRHVEQSVQLAWPRGLLSAEDVHWTHHLGRTHSLCAGEWSTDVSGRYIPSGDFSLAYLDLYGTQTHLGTWTGHIRVFRGRNSRMKGFTAQTTAAATTVKIAQEVNTQDAQSPPGVTDLCVRLRRMKVLREA